MNPSLDLNLLPLARLGGTEKAELPDLYAVTPPRRTARGRETNSLIIYLSMTGNSPLAADAQAQLLAQAGHDFYKTPGSLTSALRMIVDSINLHLLDRNLRSTSVGRQGIGQLILVALRPETLYMAQCGIVHAFLVKPNETQHLHDPQSSGRGLGLSRTPTIRYLQVNMDPDDYLVLATLSSPGWTSSSIRHPQREGIEAVRTRLLESGGQEFNTVIIQAQAGSGTLRLLRRKVESPDISRPAALIQSAGGETPTTPIPASVSDGMPTEDKRLGLPSSMPQSSEASQQPVEDRKLGIPPRPPARTSVVTDNGLTPPAPIANQQPGTFTSETSGYAVHGEESISRSSMGSTRFPKSQPSAQSSERDKNLGAFRQTLASIGSAILKALRSSMATVSEAFLRLLKNLLPDADVFRLPPSMMVFIAIAIPLVLATIGGLVFLQRGRAQQHDIYYKQAEEEAAYAAALTDPLEQRKAWQSVLADLDKAENYVLTSKSQDLRAKTVTNLDNLDAIKRLDYKQAIVGGLDSAVNVTRLIATATDLYMLNTPQGNVLRAIMTGRGYEIDPNFQCGPTYGPVNVGPLVDISELPPGSFENASLLGMDADGNLLYCVVDSQPYSAAMAPPNTGFGEPTAMTLDQGDLFVLDPKVNAVWVYRNLVVREQPRLFFGDYVPPMADVIDLTVYNDDLYLLHADGHMTRCTYSALAESPTRCDDPYPYSDNRPGRVHGPVIADTFFSQIYFLSFPERSLFLLDSQNQANYYFSVLLNLQWQYQPLAPLAEGKATAFAVSPNRTAFLAIGSYVYYAAMP